MALSRESFHTSSTVVFGHVHKKHQHWTGAGSNKKKTPTTANAGRKLKIFFWQLLNYDDDFSILCRFLPASSRRDEVSAIFRRQQRKNLHNLLLLCFVFVLRTFVQFFTATKRQKCYLIESDFEATLHCVTSTSFVIFDLCQKEFSRVNFNFLFRRYILEQHKFVHRDRIASRTFPCQLPNCIYIGRNATDTRNHLLTHNDERLFICTQPSCDYRGQTMEQLRR